MPTVNIDTDNVAGGRDGSPGNPYNTWDEAWEAEDANIDRGESWLFLFEGTTEDTAPVAIDGWPTVGGSGDTTLDFEPQSTADGAYDGDDNYSPLHYRLSASSSPTVEISGDNETTDGRTVKIEHLQLGNTTAANANIFALVSGLSGNIDILRNRFKPASTGTFPRVVRVDSGVTSAHTLRFINNLVPYADEDNLSTLNLNDALTTDIVYNNTLYYSDISGGEDAIDDVSGVTTTAINNVCFAAGGGTFIEFDIAGSITKDYNAHTNSADRGTNGLAVATGDFTDPGTADGNELTPAASQTNAWAMAGITNGDDSNVPTIDIRGNARNTGAGENTAIGCFAASGEGATTLGTPTERDTSAAVTPALDRASEADSAVGITPALDVANERDGATDITPAVGSAAELDVALDIAPGLDSANEIDEAVTLPDIDALGVATERNTATGLTPALSLAAETDTAAAIAPALDTALERDTAADINPALGTPRETDVSRDITPALDVPTERDIGITVPDPEALGVAAERNVAQDIAPSLYVAKERDNAVTLETEAAGRDTHDGAGRAEPRRPRSERIPRFPVVFEPREEARPRAKKTAKLTPGADAMVKAVVERATVDRRLAKVPAVRSVIDRPADPEAQAALVRLVALGDLAAELSFEFDDLVAAFEREQEDIAALFAMNMI